jgi:hypothetical protein
MPGLFGRCLRFEGVVERRRSGSTGQITFSLKRFSPEHRVTFLRQEPLAILFDQKDINGTVLGLDETASSERARLSGLLERTRKVDRLPRREDRDFSSRDLGETAGGGGEGTDLSKHGVGRSIETQHEIVLFRERRPTGVGFVLRDRCGRSTR